MAQSGTFADLWSYIEKEAATLKVLECKTLKACLSTGKYWKYYKMYQFRRGVQWLQNSMRAAAVMKIVGLLCRKKTLDVGRLSEKIIVLQ
jgi:hypothetical protein